MRGGAWTLRAGNFNIITLDHMKKLKNNAFVGNTGHFDNEIDLAGSEGLECMKSTTTSLRRSFSRRFPQVARQWIHVRQLPEAVV